MATLSLSSVEVHVNIQLLPVNGAEAVRENVCEDGSLLSPVYFSCLYTFSERTFAFMGLQWRQLFTTFLWLTTLLTSTSTLLLSVSPRDT